MNVITVVNMMITMKLILYQHDSQVDKRAFSGQITKQLPGMQNVGVSETS